MLSMSADLDNQPYDNVEFPIRRPPAGGGTTSGGWTSPSMTPTQRENLIIGANTKERSYTLPTVAENRIVEEEEDDTEVKVNVEDQRGKMAMGSTPNASSATSTTNPLFTTTNNTSNVITSPPKAQRMNHVNTPTKNSGQLNVSTEKRSNKSDTFPRFVSSNKPPPSPSRDSRISFVSDQSNPTEEFSWSAFTPLSQGVFEKAYTRHKYFYKFSDKVLKKGTQMKTNVWDVPGKPGETMTYEQLLQGVLTEGERLLLGGSWLHFQDVEFYEPECNKQIKPALGEGRICLTNLRMLLLCAEMTSDANISEYGDLEDKKTPGGYKLAVSKLNNVYYQNIPIDCFESVELSSTVGVTAESKLTERKPSCWGLFSCVGLGRCGYTWDATPPLPMNIVKRVIRLGVYLPPWRTPAILLVHLHPKMSLTVARDFVVQLQNHVPQMQYHMKHGATVL